MRRGTLIFALLLGLVLFWPGWSQSQALHSVGLAWDNPSIVDGYNVYRGTSSGQTNTIIAAMITAQSFTDTSVVAGTQYFYTVTAMQSGLESAKSNEITAVIPGGVGAGGCK